MDWIPTSERMPEFPEGESRVDVIVAVASGAVLGMVYRFNQHARTERGREPPFRASGSARQHQRDRNERIVL
jgi:D-Tyr-tRNAtyr deacylase